MKIAMVMVNGDQPKNREHLIVVDKHEASLLITMAEEYCTAHKKNKTAIAIFKQLEDNLHVFG